jgi:hypothetical protein
MPDYKGHYIKGNKNCTFPRRIVCFDTETNQNKLDDGSIEQTFKIGVAVYRYTRGGGKPPIESWIESDAPDELCGWIVDKCHNKEKLYVISANIWFDIRVSLMIQYLKKRKWQNKILVVNGMTIILSFIKDKKHIVFINFQNYFSVSVAVMGRVVGLPKLDVDFDNVTIRQLFTYCRRDTEIIYKSMLMLFNFIKEHNLGCFGYTTPMLAFNAYRHKFMHVKLLVHKNEKVTKIERAGYFGGRTECFKIGAFVGTKLVQVDVNSMYPYQMLKQRYPVKLAYWATSCKISTLKHLNEQGCVMATVLIDTDEPVYPVSIENKTTFPIGKFETTLSTPEIAYALKHGHIKEVKDFAYYWSDYIFKEYITYFFNLRQQYKQCNNTAYNDFCKRMMNSLYGKFGQKSDTIIEDKLISSDRCDRFTEYHVQKKRFITTTYFFGRLVKTMSKNLEGRNAIVSISAHVTAYGRMMLWKYIKKIGRKNLFYCDTDCFIMRDKPELLKHIPLSETELGAFKIEKRASKIVIHGLKDYHFARETKIKGVSKKAERINRNTYSQLMFPGILTELKKGLDKPYTVKPQIKSLKRKYNKGVVLKNNDIEPFKL